MKYCTHGTGWNPGVYAYILNEYLRREDSWMQDVEAWFEKDEVDLERGKEYAAYIINAYMGGEPYEFNGNVANTGLIPNLPPDVCVEVPVLANRKGFNPMYVGELPPQLAALNNISAAVEEMAVEGALTGDPRLIFHAICYDPLTAAILSCRRSGIWLRPCLTKTGNTYRNLRPLTFEQRLNTDLARKTRHLRHRG